MASIKLGSLLLRTLAKPLANSLKSTARNNETFRSMFVGTAQWVHRTTIRMQVFIARDKERHERALQKDIQRSIANAKASGKTDEEIKKLEDAVRKRHRPKITPLSPEKAIEAGANFVAEAFLFVVAAGLTLFEYRRGKRKDEARAIADAAKDRDQDEKLSVLHAEIDRNKRFEDRILEALQTEARNGSKICTALLKDMDDVTADDQGSAAVTEVPKTEAAAPEIVSA